MNDDLYFVAENRGRKPADECAKYPEPLGPELGVEGRSRRVSKRYPGRKPGEFHFSPRRRFFRHVWTPLLVVGIAGVLLASSRMAPAPFSPDEFLVRAPESVGPPYDILSRAHREAIVAQDPTALFAGYSDSAILTIRQGGSEQTYEGLAAVRAVWERDASRVVPSARRGLLTRLAGASFSEESFSFSVAGNLGRKPEEEGAENALSEVEGLQKILRPGGRGVSFEKREAEQFVGSRVMLVKLRDGSQERWRDTVTFQGRMIAREQLEIEPIPVTIVSTNKNGASP